MVNHVPPYNYGSSHFKLKYLQCAESALESVVGDLSKTYFVGNAPMGHTVIQPAENDKVDAPSKVLALFCSAISFFNLYSSFAFKNLKLCYIELRHPPFIKALYFAKIFFICQRFFFKSQLIATSKINVGKCEDYLWVTKDELLEYFPQHAEYLNKMIIS